MVWIIFQESCLKEREKIKYSPGLPSLSPSLPSGYYSLLPHSCRVRYFLTSPAGDTGCRNGVWEGGCVRRAKKTSWISSSHPRTTLPCLAQLGAWRFTTEDFKNISRSVFIAKHVESIAHYEFSVHFVLFPGLCPFDPSFQFVSEKQMPAFEISGFLLCNTGVCSLDRYRTLFHMLVTIFNP